jgi:hypothetical protein
MQAQSKRRGQLRERWRRFVLRLAQGAGLLSGGTATSFGNNAFGTAGTDAPTVTPLG